MSNILDTLLLVALPASGKSEVRRYLRSVEPGKCIDEFHLGPNVQLDDFPYVHLMRRIDEELNALGEGSEFFHAGDRPFKDPRDWGTLVELLNEDYHDLVAKKIANAQSAAQLLLDRVDSARAKVGAEPLLPRLRGDHRARICDKLEKEARDLLLEKESTYPASLEGKTLVIEFARGGKDGSTMPLAAPFGYAHSIGRLAPEILEKATVLYVWVTPEESRRKNTARTDPNDPGSILHHGVPTEVMLNDYGCDDMTHMVESSDKPDHITIEAHGKTWHLPVARFDNREDKTSFVRGEPTDWAAADVEALHNGLSEGLTTLWKLRNRNAP